MNKIFIEYDYKHGYYLYLINDDKKIVTPLFVKYANDVMKFILSHKEKYNINAVELDFARHFITTIYDELFGLIYIRYRDDLRDWYRNLPHRHLRVSSYWNVVLHYNYMKLDEFEQMLKI